jgi:uncharacterized protein (TIGR03437 family)
MDPRNPSVLFAAGPSGLFKTVTGAELQNTPAIGAILNAASNLPGPVAPGEIVVITGAGLGPAQLITGPSGGPYSTGLSGVSVQFGSIAAQLIYVSANQIAAIVPDSVLSSGLQITVTYEGRTSTPFPASVAPVAPGVFTLDSSGKGPAVALNQDGSLNSSTNPAKFGDLISIYVTGIGNAPVMASIDRAIGVPVTTKPLSPGVTQIDVRIPNGIQGGNGMPLLVQAAGINSQAGVTIATAVGANQPQQYALATYAGGGPPPTPIEAANAPIEYATAVTSDGAGNVYFVSSLNCVFKVDPLHSVTRVAGTSYAGYSGDGGPAINAQLSTTDFSDNALFGWPGGLVLDRSGNLYISDPGNHRVRKVSPSGVITTAVGNGTVGNTGDGGPATAAQLIYPAGLAMDNSGNLYIADVGQIRKVSPNGMITTVVQSGARGLAVDKSSNLYFSAGAFVRKASPDGTVTVLAGSGFIGDGGDGGPATSAQFIGPSGVALDDAGNIYIADVSRVRKVAPDGTISTFAGGGKDTLAGGPATSAMIDAQAVSFDSSGNLYIAGSVYVRKVSPDGLLQPVAGSPASPYYSGDGGPALDARLNWPHGVALDASGNLYIADTVNARVRKVGLDGRISTIAGTGVSGYSGDGGPATAAQLLGPFGLAIDSTGNLFIGDGSRVREVLADGTIRTVAGAGTFGYSGDGGPAAAAQLTVPSGLAVDRAGSLYILDTENNRVRKVTPDGIITTIAGTGTPGFSGDGGPAINAQLGITNGIHGIEPTGLAFDGAGNLYIADDGNVRVRKVSPDGIITTVAGSSRSLGYSGDGGPATQAQMSFPTALAADQDGNLYIGEGNRVRKVSTNGIITTIVGNDFGLVDPAGLAAGSQGRVYVADPNQNVVRLLLPLSSPIASKPDARR